MLDRFKRRAMVFLLAMFAVLCTFAAPAAEAPRPAEPTYLYKTTFVRAAPGKLLDLIALYKGWMDVHDAAKDERPLWWRHAEGDQWDLMLLIPMGSYADYYSTERLALRKKAAGASSLPPKEFQDKLEACSAWKEDLLVLGPSLETVKKAFEGASFFHVEMFIALPGKQAELCKEREMENAYQVAMGRPEYMTFVRQEGAAWDMFSLGCYRDMLHWADTGNIPKDKKDLAARQAGFKDSAEIGPTMRTLIDMHRDTMGGAIK
jgi:hypothetical protein